METVAREPITDVFLMSHGWKGDVPSAREQYGRWIHEFVPGKVYNLESSRYIREGGGMSGSHRDIAHAEVAQVAWKAAQAQ